MSEEQKQSKFPSEIIDLPSRGKLYPKDSPLRDGKIELKYMTAREEDILTSQNLIKKGVVIEKLLDSLILTKGVSTDDLVVGDKNALMVGTRVFDSVVSNFVKSNDVSTSKPVSGSVIFILYSLPYPNTRVPTISAFLSPINKSSNLILGSAITLSNNLSITVPFSIKFAEVRISSSLAVMYLTSIV
jgi:hypothetical protein